MSSRLDRIRDWEALAKDSGYDVVAMAGLCSISMRQLERFFRAHFGMRPRCWMLELQCRGARELIEKGYSSKAAAEEMNFASTSQMCHAFKKLYGCPPQTFAPAYGESVARRQ